MPVEQKTVTFDELAKFAVTLSAERRDELWLDKDNLDETTIADKGLHQALIDQIHGLVAYREKVGDWLKSVCGFEADDTGIKYVPHLLGDVVSLASLFMTEYDRYDYKGNTVLWEAFGLGGDDDVDYNGSHMSTLAEIVEAYDNAQKEQSHV